MRTYEELYKFLCEEISDLQVELGNIDSFGGEKLSDDLKNVCARLQDISSRATNGLESLQSLETKHTEIAVSDELCEEAYLAMQETQDFSIGFLQRRFEIGFGTACAIKEKLAKKYNCK